MLWDLSSDLSFTKTFGFLSLSVGFLGGWGGGGGQEDIPGNNTLMF